MNDSAFCCDKRISGHFDLDAADRIDHFSHDVRTCSFLNRTDSGEYGFIHKSFMEFFAAREFERLDQSPFAATFDKPLTPEMIEFVNLDLVYGGAPSRWLKPDVGRKLEAAIERLSLMKDEFVKNADYPVAAFCRDVAEVFREWKEKGFPKFDTMRKAKLRPLRLRQHPADQLAAVRQEYGEHVKEFETSAELAPLRKFLDQISADVTALEVPIAKE